MTTASHLCAVDEDAADCLIPKLVFQPIIENSILHGIQCLSERRGIVNLRVSAEEDILLVVISDNRVGMTKEECDTLLESISNNIMHGDHYGLHNVDERLRIFSGRFHQLQIHSQKGHGTETTIRLRKKLPI